jgi:uncharacterized protein (DUF2461 family)
VSNTKLILRIQEMNPLARKSRGLLENVSDGDVVDAAAHLHFY